LGEYNTQKSIFFFWGGGDFGHFPATKEGGKSGKILTKNHFKKMFLVFFSFNWVNIMVKKFTNIVF
jgi:hypothetical protein